MHWLLEPASLQLLIIPVVAGFIGWLTNWLAVWMTFNPLRFVGVRSLRLGWQGIVPSKAKRMAGLAVQSILDKLITMREMVDALEPRRISLHVMEQVDPLLDAWTDELMTEHYSVIWENLPMAMRRQLFAAVRKAMPKHIDDMVADVRVNVDHLLDLRPMVESHLAANPELLNRIFLECGNVEFRFLVRSGWYFGAGFGLLQAVLWHYYPAWWVLPVGGLIVGYATNWIALNMIFRPLNPVQVGPFRLQGLFLKRQKEVSEAFCRIVVEDVVTLPRLVEALLQGRHGERSRALLRRHVKPIVDDVAGRMGLVARLAMQAVLGPANFAQIKNSVADIAEREAPTPFEDSRFSRERGDRVRVLIQKRMERLPPEEFQDLLRPCFKEDELTLILVGAVLGGIAGVLQLLAMT